MNLPKILITSIFLLILQFSYGQCNNSLIDICKRKLTQTIYLKHFKVRFAKTPRRRKASRANFSVFLNKGTSYTFTTANDTTKKGKAIVKIYDDFRLYGENTTKNKEVKDSFSFECQKTGIYYLTIKFKDGKEGCAVVMLSMKEKKKKYDWGDTK